MVKILDLLCNEQAGSYRFTKEKSEYQIEDIEHGIAAVLDDSDEKEIGYYVTGVYNSGTDWAEIDVDALLELKNLCEALKINIIEGSD